MSVIKGGDATASQWMRLWVAGFVVLIFGPYLAAGLRTEHVAVYGSALVMIAVYNVRLLRDLRPALPVLLLWGGYATVAIIASFSAGNRTPWQSGSLFAGVDNVLMPLAAISVATFWGAQPCRRDLLRIACWTLVACLAVNSVISIISLYVGLDAIPGLSSFWSSAGEDESVAVLAETMGRFSGVFNQPAEAGIAYSLGAIALFHLVRSSERAPGPRELIAWALIIVGGLLTLSKVFVVGGAVLLLIMVIVPGRHRMRMALASAVVVTGFSALAFFGMSGSWGASLMFNWYRVSVQTGDSPLYTLTAGRMGVPGTNGPPSISAPEAPGNTSGGSGSDGSGSDGSGSDALLAPPPTGLGESLSEILDHHPWFGVGARGLQVAYDSTWTEVVIVAGCVGLALVALAHLSLGVSWIRLRGRLAKEEWLLGGVLLVLIAGSAFGMPSLTGNREGTLLWLFVGLLLLGTNVGKRPRAAAGGPLRDD